MGESFVIGMDLGGTNLRVAGVGADGAIVELYREPTLAREGPEPVIERIVAAIGRVVARVTGAGGSVRGVVLGAPGIISSRTGTVVASPNLPGWRDVPLRDRVAAAIGPPRAAGERRERRGVRRVLARRRQRVLEHGAADPRHRGRRRPGARRRALARGRRDGRRDRPHHRRARRAHLPLRQRRLPRDLRLGHRDRRHLPGALGGRGGRQRRGGPPPGARGGRQRPAVLPRGRAAPWAWRSPRSSTCSTRSASSSAAGSCPRGTCSCRRRSTRCAGGRSRRRRRASASRPAALGDLAGVTGAAGLLWRNGVGLPAINEPTAVAEVHATSAPTDNS